MKLIFHPVGVGIFPCSKLLHVVIGITSNSITYDIIFYKYCTKIKHFCQPEEILKKFHD